MSALFLMTGLGAIDGTIILLAASGALASWAGAVSAGLTVIAGVGTWMAARQAFPGHVAWRDHAVLLALAFATSLATVAAAWLGASMGAVELHVLPRAAGLALLLVAAQVGGLRLPAPRGVPLPVAIVAAAGLLEAAWRWTP